MPSRAGTKSAASANSGQKTQHGWSMQLLAGSSSDLPYIARPARLRHMPTRRYARGVYGLEHSVAKRMPSYAIYPLCSHGGLYVVLFGGDDPSLGPGSRVLNSATTSNHTRTVWPLAARSYGSKLQRRRIGHTHLNPVSNRACSPLDTNCERKPSKLWVA